MKTLSISSYRDVASTVDAHLAFCAQLRQCLGEYVLEAGTGHHMAAVLATHVHVNGKPFSLADHVMALELHSDEWDLHEAASETVTQVLQEAAHFKHAVDVSYDMTGFIHGLTAACSAHGMTASTSVPTLD